MTDVNREYYETLSPGREDYWRLMAAPRRRAAVVVRLVGQLAPASLVELGCGDGRLLREIRARHPKIALAGIDLSNTQIAANAAREPSIAWTAADLQQPFTPTMEADVVVAAEIIEHLASPEMLLANALRCVKPGGHLVLTTQSGPIRETEKRVGHMQHFTAASMGDLLTKTGWTPVRVWNEGWPFHDLSKWAANLDADASMRRFGDREYGPVERFVSFALRTAFLLNSRRHGAQLYAVGRRPA